METENTHPDPLLALIPTNWCDPLLTGPGAVINGPTYDGHDIERLLLAIRKRIEDASSRPANAREGGVEELLACAEELRDLMQGVIDGDYKPDSFTLQPINAALARFPPAPSSDGGL